VAHETEGKTIEDVLDWSRAEYRPPGAYGADWEESSFSDRWTPGGEDVLVFVPPLEGSPLFDGWFGFYRKQDARYVQVAGD